MTELHTTEAEPEIPPTGDEPPATAPTAEPTPPAEPGTDTDTGASSSPVLGDPSASEGDPAPAENAGRVEQEIAEDRDERRGRAAGEPA